MDAAVDPQRLPPFKWSPSCSIQCKIPHWLPTSSVVFVR